MISFIANVIGLVIFGVIVGSFINVVWQLSNFRDGEVECETKKQYILQFVLSFVPFYHFFKDIYDNYKKLDV